DLDRFRQDLGEVNARLAQNERDSNLASLRERLQVEIQAREIDLWHQRADRYPAEPSFRVELGIRLLKAVRFDEALETFLQLRQDPNWGGRCLLYAAYCHLNCRQWRKAEPLLREALTRFGPEDAASKKEVLYLLAQNAAEAGRWEEAVSLGENLAQQDPDY